MDRHTIDADPSNSAQSDPAPENLLHDNGSRPAPDGPGFLARFRPQAVALIGLLFLMPLACTAAYVISDNFGRQQLEAHAEERLVLHDANLTADLRRHAAVPRVLATDWQIINLLTVPNGPAIDAVNHRLHDIAQALHALAVYVMDIDGRTIASSNWQEPSSFIGLNFDYRAYFTDAIRTGEGRQFALGTSSMLPGYYTSNRVERDGRPIGVVVLKMGFEALEINWRTAPEHILVTDREGVVFITNTTGWRYHRLPEFLLPPGSSAHAISVSGPNTEQPITLRSLPWRQDVNRTVRLTDSKPERLYLLNTASLPDSDWSIHILTSFEPVSTRNWIITILTGSAVLLATLLAMGYAQRRAALADRLKLHRVAQSRLERRIADVTAELREKENELTQAAKLAALGQMSAGIAHEINQPLTAIRSYADNAVILLQRGRPETAIENLREISGLTERMAQVSRQLKGFARRASPALVPVDPVHAINQSLSLLQARLRRDGIKPRLNLPEVPLSVLAEDVRLQQILVNLLTNAADAALERDQPQVTITLEGPLRPDAQGPDPATACARIIIADNGPGLSPEVLASLFRPFVTTKKPGRGLGLGLSISHGIVEDFGGTLTACNQPTGGAVFTMTLKIATAQIAAAQMPQSHKSTES